ncbi:exosortase A [Erythrobacter sp. HKB08]|uniref:exosortase A n=1 Tax=Erythrobacter sp. HKB08 TaxID=2502843 RepID=UPI001008D267|nr:exosortase A [Erythrobacter sp. HKB08]
MARGLNFALPSRATWSQAIPQVCRAPLAHLAIAALALFVAHFRDWANMADQWWNVSTFNHVLFVPLIVGWLVYSRRSELAKIEPTSWLPGFVPLLGSLFVWLLGTLASVNTVSQLGTLGALISCVLLFLGPRVSLACVFPLAYLSFLVPIGEELVPSLQMITAYLVIALTEWSGIPAVIDGVFIDTPAGLFEVAEACSGVQFLVAMAALAALVAYACFKSWKRRIVFLVTAMALPIVANGVRAWGTIYIAQSQGIEFAEGFDHVFYGWIFFALVVFALLAIFWRWFDRDPEDLGIDFPALVGSDVVTRVARYTGNAKLTLAAMLLGLLATLGWASAAMSAQASIPPRIEALPVAGWTRVAYEPGIAWEPRMTGAARKFVTRYRDASGREVDVVIGIYSGDESAGEPGAFGEGALVPETPWRWLAPWQSSPEASGEILQASGFLKRHVLTSYRIGDTITGSTARLKLATLQSRLAVSAEPTVVMIISAEGQDDDTAAQVIEDFVASVGGRAEWMDRTAGLR